MEKKIAEKLLYADIIVVNMIYSTGTIQSFWSHNIKPS